MMASSPILLLTVAFTLSLAHIVSAGGKTQNNNPLEHYFEDENVLNTTIEHDCKVGRHKKNNIKINH